MHWNLLVDVIILIVILLLFFSNLLFTVKRFRNHKKANKQLFILKDRYVLASKKHKENQIQIFLLQDINSSLSRKLPVILRKLLSLQRLIFEDNTLK